MEAVTGHTFNFENAILQGYARYVIKGQTFPGIIATDNQSVTGIVYDTIDEVSLQRLDKFESDVYYRKEVTVILDNRSQVPAYTYVIAPEHSSLLTGIDWDPVQFQEKHLDAYIRRIK